MVLETTPAQPVTEMDRALVSMKKSYAMYDELGQKAKQDEMSDTERAIYERMPTMIREAELKLITRHPEFDEAYADILQYKERVHALHSIVSLRRELIRVLATVGELTDQKDETKKYEKHMDELRQLRDDFEDRINVFKKKWPRGGELPEIVEHTRDVLAGVFADEVSDDEAFAKSIEKVVEVSDEVIDPTPSSETAEVERPDFEVVSEPQHVSSGPAAKLSAIREPYLEAKRQYRDIQHTLTEEERREFRSKLAILASTVHEAEDRHYNAFFTDEISPVPAPTPQPSPMASLASASTPSPTLARSRMGGKVSGPVWRRVVSGLASSLKLNDE